MAIAALISWSVLSSFTQLSCLLVVGIVGGITRYKQGKEENMKIRRLLVVSLFVAPAYVAAAALAQSSDTGPVMDIAFGPEMRPPDGLALGPGGPGPVFGPGPEFGPGFGPPDGGPKCLARFAPGMMAPSFHPPFPFAGIDLSDDQV